MAVFLEVATHAAIMNGRFAPGGSRTELGLLPRVHDRIAFAEPDLGSLLGGLVLDEDFTGMVCLELPNETGIPELTGDAKIFATPHHGI